MHFKETNPKQGSVLIVGAGPTGLTLACELARRNINFRIIDQAKAYFNGSRAKGLQPRSLEILEDLGVIDQILKASDNFPVFRTYNVGEVLADRTLFELLSYEAPKTDPAVPYPQPRVIPQWKTEDILREKLAEYGHTVELDHKLLTITAENSAVKVTIEHQNEIQESSFDFVIGADGGRSSVRKLMEIGFEGETYESERTLIGDVEAVNSDRGFCNMYTKAGDIKNRVSLWPLPGTESFQFIATMDTDAVPELNLVALQQILEERSGRKDIRIKSVSWISLYKVNVRMAEQFRKGNVFLAGDAAHIHSSAGGQGLNTGIQDGYNLGWKLALAIRSGSKTLLDTYEEERLPVAAEVLNLTSRLHKNQFGNAVKPLDKDKKVSPDIFQLNLNYRNSSLSFHELSSEMQLQAGDRAPDATIKGSSGALSRLFLLYQGAHFTVLAFGIKNDVWVKELNETYPGKVCAYRVIKPGEEPTNFCITDIDGTIKENYGLESNEFSDFAVLVRPDHYIGVISHGRSNSFNEYFKLIRA